MEKVISSLSEIAKKVTDGMTIMIGGFGGSGAPIELIHALIDHRPKNLTVINNNTGNGQIGLAAMINAGMVKKLICSFPRSADPQAFNEAYAAKKLELELVPQGTLAERIRAGGAGIPAFYTPTSVGTMLAEGKPTEVFDGKTYVRERWLKADVSLLQAEHGDRMGNLTYRMAARNFSPIMATAATQTFVQVSKIVAAGAIHPEHIITPGIYIDGMVEVANPAHEEDLNRKGASYP